MKQGRGTADLMMPFGDWFFFFSLSLSLRRPSGFDFSDKRQNGFRLEANGTQLGATIWKSWQDHSKARVLATASGSGENHGKIAATAKATATASAVDSAVTSAADSSAASAVVPSFAPWVTSSSYDGHAINGNWDCIIIMTRFSLRYIDIGRYYLFSREPRLYKRVCPSVGPSVRPSVGPSVGRSVMRL